MSSTYKDIKKFTGVLQRASGYLKVNKVNTELLATLVEMFFVSQEVSESIAEKLGYTIDVCELECFCTKCQAYVEPSVDSLQKRISNKVNKTFLSRLSAQEKLAKEILKALETEKIWNRQSFSLLHNLGRSIAKFLKEETGITSDHNRNHSIELHLFSYRYCGHCKVFFNQKENSKHVHPSTASSQPNPPQIMDLNNNVTVKKSPRIKLNPLLVRFTENLEETMVKICENAEELEKFNQYLPMSMQLRRLFLTGKRSKVDVYLSGSRVYGLGSSKSELDIYVNINDTFEGRSQDETKLFIDEAIELLSSKPLIWTICKDPGLVAFNKDLKIYCNISFNSGLNWANTKLIQHYFKMQPDAIKIAHFVRLWFDNSDIVWPLDHHTLVVMLIFYLQSRLYLPTVELLQKSSKFPKTAENFRVDFDKESKLQDFETLKPIQDYTRLLAGFFHFYVIFNYRSKVICPFFGKMSRESVGKLTERFQIGGLDHNSPLVVLDLFNYSKNLTCKFTTDDLRNLKHFCYNSRGLLVKTFGFSKST